MRSIGNCVTTLAASRSSQGIFSALRAIGLALLLLVGGSAIGFAPAALAANTGCTVVAAPPPGTTANCPDVPPDGIRYDNSGVDTINTSNGTPGVTTVTPSGTAGIFLRQAGGDTNSAPSTVAFTTVTADVGGGDNETVLADPSDPTVAFKSGGQFVIQHTDSHGVVVSYTIGATTYTPTALATFLTSTPGIAGSVTAGSTVNNLPSGGNAAASFITTNADGIHVESSGGKGGDGGCTTILLATWCDDGDKGGGAGSVAVNSDGSITVNGTSGIGVSATSIGGAGGHGGGGFGLFVSAAGHGGKGGAGGDVNVSLGTDSKIVTFGDGGHGVYAVSHGGNGGAGGDTSGLIALGDKGGDGGDAGDVTVNNQGSIITHGTGAYGIFAESMGAGAGAGSGSGGLVAIGGNGGGQSSGADVTITNGGSIQTEGLDSYGIFAESVGGGGGDGGNSGGLFSVGGHAGSGGNANLVTITNTGSISTIQDGSTALFAQSVGGGGGNGGNATSVSPGVSVAIGGVGGLGGNGGQVIVNGLTGQQHVSDLTYTQIATSGNRANGIQAQSVGGGGGNGGFALSVAVPAEGVSLSFAIGGNGGGGGNSDIVTVNENGDISTGGDQSIGIFAQSVGGGGGNGGGSVAGAVGGAYNLSVAMGGTGGVAGNGAAVTVDALGTITTTGTDSYGILAQSVGGGGGNGGYAVAGSVGGMSGSLTLGGGAGGGGFADDVTVTSGAMISTSGAGAIGIVAQSVGGGGGNGGLAGSFALGGGALSVGLGGAGGDGSYAGLVTVDNEGQITTTGNNAAGVFAQSVGGGGGNGGMALTLSGAVVSGAASVGGSGGAGSYGGAVKVTNAGTIITGVKGDASTGIDSYGVFAQSVGGGGGDGGMALSGTIALSPPDVPVPAVAVAVSIGGKGGGASNGGQVTVDNTGSIETYGLGAHAIYAQSVGGGGGNGGVAGALAVSMGASESASFGIAVGGPATGGGGDAGEVDVNNGKVGSDGKIILAADPDPSTNTALITNAVGADGIHAQSVGGGGGDGGYALAATISGSETGSVSASVAIGGKGGTGGKGGKVDVVNTALIQTLGNQSDGIFAQSAGGGGGDGGMAITGTLAFSQTTGAVGVTIGGTGGTGSIGGLVTVDNYGQISTAGNDSAGIFAESIGGGGGTGGLALGVQMMASTKQGATIGVTVGGSGGNGNNGGEVDVTNHAGATINTTGLAANGITAQSVGGGGGDGGLAANAQLNAALPGEEASKSLAVNVAVGGSGGTGGQGGIVNVTNDGDIDVTGLASMGIFAQSVGGGGGDGGNAVTALGMVTDKTNPDSRSVAINVTVGGAAGSGNIGGAVTVNNTGSIVTTKGSGYGIFAESVGGGGGIGGRANTISMVVTDACTLPVVCTGPKSSKNNMSASFSIGGNGGTGGNGGAVKVTNSGDIDTSGDASDGIFAQSVGAGGGNGGNGVLGSGGLLPIPLEVATVPVGSVPFYKNLTVAVGGKGGATGDGKSVEVDNSGSITTRGANSNGATLESVGGGGGIGGDAAIGITGLVGVGGKGGAGGSGGDVTFKQTIAGNIETLGVSSDGIFAQSVGGGGGVAGNVDRLLPDGAGPIPSINLGIGLAFGQGGGSGGNGGIVDVTTDGEIATLGDDANGIFAQSVGGGGGVQGTLGNDIPVLNLLSWHVGSNGDIGNGGAVNVNVTGNISTSGNGADGIFAQSAGGKAGTVSSTDDNGIITTTSALGTGGNVTVKVDGSVITAAGDPQRGFGSVGILAQSVGLGGNGNVEVDIDSTTGLVQGGRSGTLPGVQYATLDSDALQTAAPQDVTGIGVEILDGKDNTVNNHGTITTADGVTAGYAILATGSNTEKLGYVAGVLTAGAGQLQAGGNDTVNNFGTVTGSFDLGVGTNAFNNNALANLNMGAIAMVGVGNLIDNAGWMSPGGLGRVMTTAVTGNLTQDSTGTYGVDLDLSKSGLPSNLPNGKPGEADLIDVTGTLKMSGDVDLSLLNVGDALPGTHVVTIAHSDTGFASTASDLTLNSPATAVANYALASDANNLMLDYGINFAPAGMTPNETSIGEYINNVQTYLGTNPGGTTALEPIVAALYNLPDLPSYASALDQLIPSPYVVNQVTDMMAGLQFENSLLSCKVYDGVARFNAEGECGWVQASGRHSEADATSTVEGYDIASGGFSAGAQRALSENLRVGLAASWDNIAGMIGDSAQTTGNRFQLGGVVKAVYGDTTLAATVSGGLSLNDVNRTVDPAGGPSYALTGDQMLGYLAGHLRLSQTLDAGGWYVRPMVDVGVTTVAWPDMTESGGPVAVNVLAGTNTFVTALPAVEIGGEYKVADGVVARPFLRAGALTLLSGSAPSLSAGFVAAPDGISPFTVGTDIDDVMLDLVAGVDVISSTNMTLRATAGADIGQTTRSYTGNLKFSAPF